MSHFIEKCSCGATITQCRCPDPNKSVVTVPNGCHACKKAAIETAYRNSSLPETLREASELIEKFERKMKPNVQGLILALVDAGLAVRHHIASDTGNSIITFCQSCSPGNTEICIVVADDDCKVGPTMSFIRSFNITAAERKC